jgi:hypothetical protein
MEQLVIERMRLYRAEKAREQRGGEAKTFGTDVSD